MDTESEAQEAWQVSVHVDGTERGIAHANVTRGEALLLANEMNAAVYQLLIEQEWMPAIIAIPSPEGPGRRVFREVMKDLDDLEFAPTSIEATSISNPTLDYVIGRWAHLENNTGEVGWNGYVVAGTNEPSVLVETADGDRQMLPLQFVRAVSEPMERPKRRGRR